MTRTEFQTEPVVSGEIKTTKNYRKKLAYFLLVVALAFMVGYQFLINLNQAPSEFPVGTPVTIPEGASANDATLLLKEGGYVRSSSLLNFVLILWYDPNTVKASTYIFTEPLSTFKVAKEITNGRFSDDLIKFTHIEGESVATLGRRAEEVLPLFNRAEFVELAKAEEGYLFPETYLIPAEYTAFDLYNLLRKTFDEKIATIQDKINNQSLSLSEIVVLASIIEREANSLESKRMVSGILQRRLAIDMPLQADASIEYVLDKPLKELTPEDLKLDSPYNTYLNLGLPPTPIGNPGLESIMAVIDPEITDYLFYITGNDGQFYYAVTYDQHLENVARYLR